MHAGCQLRYKCKTVGPTVDASFRCRSSSNSSICFDRLGQSIAAETGVTYALSISVCGLHQLDVETVKSSSCSLAWCIGLLAPPSCPCGELVYAPGRRCASHANWPLGESVATTTSMTSFTVPLSEPIFKRLDQWACAEPTVTDRMG